MKITIKEYDEDDYYHDEDDDDEDTMMNTTTKTMRTLKPAQLYRIVLGTFGLGLQQLQKERYLLQNRR